MRMQEELPSAILLLEIQSGTVESNPSWAFSFFSTSR